MDSTYLCGTITSYICFGDGKSILMTYMDADWARDVDFKKSTSSYLMNFAGDTISWQSKLQKCSALSTTKANILLRQKHLKNFG
jgi:hypothetical protein